MKCDGLLAMWVQVDTIFSLNESDLVNSHSGCITSGKVSFDACAIYCTGCGLLCTSYILCCTFTVPSSWSTIVSTTRYKLATDLMTFTWNVLQLIEVAYLDCRI